MNDSQRGAETEPPAPLPEPPVFFNGRVEFASRFISGSGLEIGALHRPLPLPRRAKVSYVDWMTTDRLREEYPELRSFDLVTVDVVDDGQKLQTVADQSQDFIIANHFLEHCEDPIGTIGLHLSKLRPAGVLFYTVPDKRYTFDFRRPVTPLDHLISDHAGDAPPSRHAHYEEWVRLVDSPDHQAGSLSQEEVRRRAEELDQANYSIHMHVWTQAEFLEMIVQAGRTHENHFDIEAAARRGHEFMVVLRKEGPLANPTSFLPQAIRRLGRGLPEPAKRRARRVLDRLQPL